MEDHAPVAQRIEHLTTDQKVRGSNPFGRTSLNSQYGDFKIDSPDYCPIDCPIRHVNVLGMAPRKRPTADLTGIRQRGARFQVRVFGGIDPATGKQLILTGSAASEAEAIALRDDFRKQTENHTAVRTNVTLRVLLAEWLAGHQVEPSTRASYALLIDKFILPALGDKTDLADTRPARPAPVREALRGAAQLPSPLQRQGLHRAPNAAPARVR
jgi:hypothetical protein